MPSSKSDAQIQQEALEELKWDTRVEATDVGVEVDRGIVTLTGTVATYAEKYAAREAAHRVAGVLDVADDLQVVLPGSGKRTDTELAEAVRLALIMDTFLPEERIQSTVSDGWVTLAGELDSWQQRLDAEETIRQLRGIRGVTNLIQITGPRVAPQTIRKSIEAALERRAEREAQRIEVQVEDGAVTLRGDVQNWAEETAILGAAAHAPGVRSITNELRIVPSL